MMGRRSTKRTTGPSQGARWQRAATQLIREVDDASLGTVHIYTDVTSKDGKATVAWHCLETNTIITLFSRAQLERMRRN